MALRKTSPRAPTRLAKNEPKAGDDHKTRVYYHPESDTFLIVDLATKPTRHHEVVTGTLDDHSLIIEPYYGQRAYGVVRVLEIFRRSAQFITGTLAPIAAALLAA
jgi:hypothetical protein